MFERSADLRAGLTYRLQAVAIRFEPAYYCVEIRALSERRAFVLGRSFALRYPVSFYLSRDERRYWVGSLHFVLLFLVITPARFFAACDA